MVTDARGIVELIMLMTGSQAARVRRQAAELLVRYLGGDMCIVDEVCALRGLQEELAAERPDDPDASLARRWTQRAAHRVPL